MARRSAVTIPECGTEPCAEQALRGRQGDGGQHRLVAQLGQKERDGGGHHRREGRTVGFGRLFVGADFAVDRPLPPPSRTTTVDGYKVTPDGTLAAGGMSMLTMTVRRSGQPVSDLEPLLGALGHLVTIAASHRSYLHVHPMEMPVGPGQVMFHIVFPAAGTYRLFFQFQHGGVVGRRPLPSKSPAPAVGAAVMAVTTNQPSRPFPTASPAGERLEFGRQLRRRSAQDYRRSGG